MRRRVEDTARSGVFLTNFEVSNASYHFSNKMILEGETKDAKINSFFYLISKHSLIKHQFPLYFLYELIISLRKAEEVESLLN